MIVKSCIFWLLFVPGTLLLVASQSEDSDLLWTVSNNSFPFQVQLMEAHVSLTHSHHWLMYKELSSMFEYIQEVYVPHELK